jgi:2-oxoglutarate/2-oxoacid ferredoxin oxidoreductase subunit beta
VARSVDTDLVLLGDILGRAARHKGSAFVEILQNCIVFNDGAWAEVADKSTRDDKVVTLVHGQPLIFGKGKNKGIRLKGFEPEVVEFEPGKPPKDLLVHDEKTESPALPHLLARMNDKPGFPMPQGVFRAVLHKPLHELMDEQIAAARKAGEDDLQELLKGPETWEVAR